MSLTESGQGDGVMPDGLGLPAGQEVFLIKAFTLGFDFSEDRIRVDAADALGRSRIIWLTQRMANLLVVALVKDLDRQVVTLDAVAASGQEPQTGLDTSFSKHPDAEKMRVEARDLAHEIAQQRAIKAQAQDKLKSGDSVRVQAAADALSWLCRRIDLTPTRQGTRLEWTDDAGHAALFQMTQNHERALLEALAKVYRKSGWPCGLFPAWLNPRSLSARIRPADIIVH